MDYEKKKVLVVGMARSGVAAAQLLRASGAEVTVNDSKTEEELGQITGKYFRGSNAAGQEGYGLGMYLVKWYMEKQSGGLEYYNDDGFVVELLVRKV